MNIVPTPQSPHVRVVLAVPVEPAAQAAQALVEFLAKLNDWVRVDMDDGFAGWGALVTEVALAGDPHVRREQWPA